MADQQVVWLNTFQFFLPSKDPNTKSWWQMFIENEATS